MPTESRPVLRPDPALLMAQAEAGGPEAALAARRAAILAERSNPELSRRALALAIRLAPSDPAPRLALARMHAEAGDLEAARAEAGIVFKEAPDEAARARAAFMLGEIARVQGETARARDHFEAVLRIEDRLLARDRTDPIATRWYARARGRIAELDAGGGERTRALAGAEGALAMLRASAAHVGEPPELAADIADAEMRLAALELDDNRPASARRRLAEAIGRYEALAITEPDEPHWRAVLSDAWALAAEADYARAAADAARSGMDKALQARLKLAAADPLEAWALAGVWRLRAALRDALGDHDVAEESYGQALAIAERLCARAPHADAPARFLVHTLLDRADQALRMGAAQPAYLAANAARERCENFARQPNAHATWFSDLGAAWDRLGEAARLAGSVHAVQDALSRAVEFRRAARERAPSEARFARGLAAALLKLGDVHLASDSPESARAAFSESTVLRLQLAEALPGDTVAAHALAVALERVGLAAFALGDRNAARAAWEDELTLADRIYEDPDSIDAVRFRAIVSAHLAEAGGADAETHRQDSLACFDILAQAGALTEQEAALRRRLWGG